MGLKGGKGQDFRCPPPFPIAKGGGFCIMGARGRGMRRALYVSVEKGLE